MRAVAARACRNPYETIGFSRISSYDFNKTYENIRLSHPKIMKICQRAQAESFKNHGFFQHSCQMGLRGHLARAPRTPSIAFAGAPSVSNNTMRATCARRRVVVVVGMTKSLFFQHLCHKCSREPLSHALSTAFARLPGATIPCK